MWRTTPGSRTGRNHEQGARAGAALAAGVPPPGGRGALGHAPPALHVPRPDQCRHVRGEPLDLRALAAAPTALAAGRGRRAGERGADRRRQALQLPRPPRSLHPRADRGRPLHRLQPEVHPSVVRRVPLPREGPARVSLPQGVLRPRGRPRPSRPSAPAAPAYRPGAEGGRAHRRRRRNLGAGMNGKTPGPGGSRGITAIDGAIALLVILLIVQMWLLTATLETYLAGH